MTEINGNLRRELLEMEAEDLRVRAELAETGELFDGYNATMEKVHLRNAARLEEIIAEFGWTGKSLVGEDGASAAWLILQHAISRPDLQRKGLEILRREVEKGEIPAAQIAYLQDRILCYEGKLQLYGTQFDWNERGELLPNEIFEPENIDARRAKVGLETPYSEVVKVHSETVKNFNEMPPQDFDKRQRDYEEWARKTGWRD